MAPLKMQGSVANSHLRPHHQRSKSQLPSNVVELLRPGSFVRLHKQPHDLPPFQLIQCRGGRCWVRQQAWGQLIHWEVEHRQLTSVA